MSAASGGFRIVLRLARRGTALTALQALLIVALVALPVAVLAGGVLVLQSRHATVAEQLDADLGHTEARLSVVNQPDPTLRQHRGDPEDWSVAYNSQGLPVHGQDGALVDPRTVLPAGTEVLRVADSSATVRTAAGLANLPVTLGPVADPALRGRFDLVSGTVPSDADEMLVTQAALTRLGVRVGDSVTMTAPVSEPFTVVGVMKDHRSANSLAELFLPDGAFAGTPAAPELRDYSYYVPTVNPIGAEVTTLNKAGVVVESRALAARDGLSNTSGPGMDLIGYLEYLVILGLLTAFELVLLAGSAFHIGARSRQRVLATIASVGASRRALFAIVSSGGILLGAVGGAVGVGLGIGGGSVYLALTRDGSFAHYPGFHLEWMPMVGIGLFAVICGWLSALLPAISAARTDIVAALRGATRPRKPRLRVPIGGLIVAAIGAAGTICGGVLFAWLQSGVFKLPHGSFFYRHASLLSSYDGAAIAGAVIVMQIGLMLAGGAVLSVLSRVLGRLGLAARLASRDLARNRTRAVPAVAAIMACSFIAMFVAGLVASDDATASANYQYSSLPGQERIAVGAQGSGVSGSMALSALKQTLSVRNARVIESGPLADSGVSTPSSAAKDAVPMPGVAQADQCPAFLANAQSVDSTYALKSSDWRCTDRYSDALLANGQLQSPVLIGGAADLALLTGHPATPAQKATLSAGGAVVFHRQFLDHGRARLDWYTPAAMNDPWAEPGGTDDTRRIVVKPVKQQSLPAVLATTAVSLPYGMLMSPATATELGMSASPQFVLADLKHPATAEQSDALTQALQVASHGAGLQAYVEAGPASGSARWQLVLLGVSCVVTLAAAVVALALARGEGRRDAATLGAVGAPPSLHRGFAFWQGFVVVGTGTVLGAVTATIAVFALQAPNSDQLWSMPWADMLGATFGIALLVGAGAWLFARRASEIGATRAAIA